MVMDWFLELKQRWAKAESLSDIEKTKFWIVECFWHCGGFHSNTEPFRFIGRYASTLEKGPEVPCFAWKHVGYAMRMMVEADFMDGNSSPCAVASVYLATRLEFIFRMLSGVLDFEGRWTDEETRKRYAENLKPKNGFGKQISNVEWTFRIAIADPNNPRTIHLRDLNERLKVRLKEIAPNQEYEDIGERIARLRHPGAHGLYWDLSGDRWFYALLLIMIFLSEDEIAKRANA